MHLIIIINKHSMKHSKGYVFEAKDDDLYQNSLA
ncbi:hypothetical protein [Salmonella enterica]